MTQLEWCVVLSQENKVCKLLKYLYILKWAPKYWYEKLDNVLYFDDFFTNGVDTYVYTKYKNSECVIC